MKSANTKGADKFFHCKANCEATKLGPAGESEAKRISNIREIVDQNIKGDSADASAADQEANQAGRDGVNSNPDQSCSASCSQYIVPGMDENGDFTEGVPVPEPEPEPIRKEKK